MFQSSPIPAIDPIKSQLSRFLVESLNSLSEAAILDELTLFSLLERPKNETHGDYALPCFRFAKQFGKPPAAVASLFEATLNKIAENSADSCLLEQACAVSGFLNLTFKPRKLQLLLLPEILNGKYFAAIKNTNTPKERVMIEYSQPNTHKNFHIGHVRNVALGDSLGRIYRYVGDEVTMANYLGDEGAHIAKCLWYIKANNLTLPETDQAPWLDEQYRLGNQALEAAEPDEKAKIQASLSKILSEIESKKGETYELWQETKAWSIQEFQRIYTFLDARFDHWFYESEVSEESQQIVDEYLASGVFVVDDGAVGLDLSDDKLGFALLRKRDGNTLYATKDLALARRKFKNFGIDRSIYVVASEQNLHFKQVFKVLSKMGFEQAKKCFHLSYGMVNLPEGKMSTRTGNTVSFIKLKEEILQELDQVMERQKQEWSSEQFTATKNKLAGAAIRFGMIATDPVKDIVFDLKNWVNFEGFSGPYLIYAYARTQSILSKARDAEISFSGPPMGLLVAEDEIQLMRQLNDFNPVILQALEAAKPSILAHYLYDLSKTYNRFLANCPVLNASTPQLKSERLRLITAFVTVLAQGLDLIGMPLVEKM